MKPLLFTIPGAPTTKGRPRFSRKLGRAFTPAKTRAAEESMAARALVALRAAGVTAPTAEPIELTARFILPIPGSWPRWQVLAACEGRYLPVGSRTDVDNYAKALLDALNGILYVDDVQVVRLDVAKTYGALPCIDVGVRALEQAIRGPDLRSARGA